jgi:hypothetical protein
VQESVRDLKAINKNKCDKFILKMTPNAKKIVVYCIVGAIFLGNLGYGIYLAVQFHKQSVGSLY